MKTPREMNWHELTDVMIRTGNQEQLDAVEAEMRARPECAIGGYAAWRDKTLGRVTDAASGGGA